MSKQSEVIAARRTALGLRVIVNDAMPASAPMLKAASPAVLPTPVGHREAVLDTSTAFANHCTDGVGIIASGVKSTVAPGAVASKVPAALSRLSLVPVDGL